MAKIVKDFDEAKRLGMETGNSGQKDIGSVVVEGLKEFNKAISSIQSLRNQNQPQNQPQEKQNPEMDGRDFIVSSNDDIRRQAQPFESKKKDESTEMKPTLITINQKKIEEQLEIMLKKNVPMPFDSWTIQDLKNNYGMAKLYLMPKLIEIIKYSIEIKEVKQ